MKVLGAVINIAYFENQSTTTKTEPIPFTLGIPVMKSIETEIHGLSGIGRGCSKPTSFWVNPLSCWQIRQVLTYNSMSNSSLGQ